MPNRDGTGPMGQGPRSGGRRGACAGKENNANTENGGNTVFGIGKGGRPRGGGKGNCFGGGKGWKNRNNQ